MHYGNFRSQGLNKRNHHCHKALDEPILDGDMRRCSDASNLMVEVNADADVMEAAMLLGAGGHDDLRSYCRHEQVLYCPSSVWAHLRLDRGCVDLYSYEMKIATLIVSRWVRGDRTLFTVDEVPTMTTRRHLGEVRKLFAPHHIEVPSLPYVRKLEPDAESADDTNGRRDNERLRWETMTRAVKDATGMLQKSLRARKAHSVIRHYAAAVDRLSNACAMDAFLGVKHKWAEVRPEDIYPEVTQAKLALEGHFMTDLDALGYPSDIFNPAEVLIR